MTLRAVDLPDSGATERFAQRLAPLLRRGDVLALAGRLGAGKTAFTRAMLRALGVAGEVPSPTFTLVQIYDLPSFPAYHFDLYRLKDEAELDELGWDDAQSEGLVIAEWPDRAGGRLSGACLRLTFEIMERGQRRCTMDGDAVWDARLKEAGL